MHAFAQLPAAPCRAGALAARHSAPRPLQLAAPRVARPAPRPARRRTCVAAAGEEPDVAVFRFTLGIPGFDDAQLPRVIGVVGGLLLAANHALGGAASAGLTRTEVFGLLLGSLCYALPTVGERLEEARGGVRANATTGNVKQAFLLDESLSASTSQELAWATFALLTTTNASCAVLVRDGAVACARGTLSAAALAGGLGGLAATLAPAVARVRADGTGAVQYFADSPPFPGMAEAFSARSALVLPLARSGDFLLVCATAPRAFDAKARAVASSLATKLSTAFADK